MLMKFKKSLEEVFQHISVKEYLVFWKFPFLKKVISEYIENYPAKIRVLDYKNSEVLEKFRKKVNNEIELFH